MDYVSVALFAPIGRRQLERRSLGSIIQYLGVVDARTVLVPRIARDAQRYIGDKVRQAERLRERARKLESEFVSTVTTFTVRASEARPSKTSRISSDELGRNLNPGAYTQERRAIRATLKASGGRFVADLATVETPTTDNYSSSTFYVGLDAIDSATCNLSPSTVAAEEISGTARLLREGPVISRLRPYLNKVTYVPSSLAGSVGSGELLSVSPKPDIDGWLLYGVLKLESSVRQLNPVATGSTHPRVDREDILELLVPWHDDQAKLGKKLSVAQGCYFASRALITAAKLLVEHLIEGRLTESELIEAQQALEAADRGADRAILQGLRRGDAADGPPLFPDLDALYALLDETTEAGNG